ncbi:hypothetical protein ZWY2020_027955 [Hordeum vulgare]|nr:hypothetical protein ZWY2020_027955 [Hordeum vulgare]
MSCPCREARAAAPEPNELLDHGALGLRLVGQRFETVRILYAPGARLVAHALLVGGVLMLSAFEPLVIFLILVVNAAVEVQRRPTPRRRSAFARSIRPRPCSRRVGARPPATSSGGVVMVAWGQGPADMPSSRLVSSNLTSAG